MTEQLKEVQPSVQFEEWWAKFRDSKDWEAEDISDQTIARAAWQAALASKSAPVDWEKIVREKFPDAWQDPDGSINRWGIPKKLGGGITTKSPCFPGYSWQHAAHHPDVIGGGK